MAEHIRKCPSCGKYTLGERCCEMLVGMEGREMQEPGSGASCNTAVGNATVLARPPKFSLNDRYAPLRREARREELRLKGWL